MSRRVVFSVNLFFKTIAIAAFCLSTALKYLCVPVGPLGEVEGGFVLQKMVHIPNYGGGIVSTHFFLYYFCMEKDSFDGGDSEEGVKQRQKKRKSQLRNRL